MRYIKGVVTLKLDTEACTGCGMCVQVCPHRVFELREKKAVVGDRDACIECGGCSGNCPADAISVSAGVGCAKGLINTALGRGGDCCCSGECCSE